MMKTTFLGSFFICIIFCLLPTQPVVAQLPSLDSISSGAKRSGIELTPAIFEQIIKPGQSTAQKITITNITSDFLLIRTRAKPLVPYEEILNKKDQSRFDSSLWVAVADPDFILEPGKIREVDLTIKAPDNAEPGGHYVQIVFELLLPEQQDKSMSSAINLPNVASLGFLTIPGDIREQMWFGSGITPGLLSFGTEVKLPIALENSGNIHSIATTTVKVRNWHGKVIKDISVDPRIVLPNTRREFDATWQRGLRLGLYSVEITTTYGTPNLRLSTGRMFVLSLLNIPLFLLLLATLMLVGVLIIKRERFGYVFRVFRGRVYKADQNSATSGKKYMPNSNKMPKKRPKLWKNRW